MSFPQRCTCGWQVRPAALASPRAAEVLAAMARDFDFRNRVFPVTRIDDADALIDRFVATGYEDDEAEWEE